MGREGGEAETGGEAARFVEGGEVGFAAKREESCWLRRACIGQARSSAGGNYGWEGNSGWRRGGGRGGGGEIGTEVVEPTDTKKRAVCAVEILRAKPSRVMLQQRKHRAPVRQPRITHTADFKLAPWSQSLHIKSLKRALRQEQPSIKQRRRSSWSMKRRSRVRMLEKPVPRDEIAER